MSARPKSAAARIVEIETLIEHKAMTKHEIAEAMGVLLPSVIKYMTRIGQRAHIESYRINENSAAIPLHRWGKGKDALHPFMGVTFADGRKPREYRFRELLEALKTRDMTLAELAKAIKVGVSTAGEYISRMRREGYPVRVAGAGTLGGYSPIYGYGEEPDAFDVPVRKAIDRRKAAPVIQKCFPDGEWDKSLFDMSQYQCKPNPWDAWLFDKRAA